MAHDTIWSFCSLDRALRSELLSGVSRCKICRRSSIPVGILRSKSNYLKIWNSACWNISFVYSYPVSFRHSSIIYSKSRIQFSHILTARPKHVPAINEYISSCMNSLSATNLSNNLMANMHVLSRNPYKHFMFIIQLYTFYFSSRDIFGDSLTSDISPSLKLLLIIFFFRSASMLYLRAYLLYFLPV